MKLSTKQHRRLVTNLTGQAEDQTGRNVANQQTGANFERRLDGYHAELMATGQAMIMRTNPKIRMTGPGRAAIVGKGEVDYVAFLLSGAVIHFDAKSRTGKAFSTGDDMEHQVRWLTHMALYGHQTGLLVWWKDFQECRWHSIDSFDRRVRFEAGRPMIDIEWLRLFA